MLDEDLVKEAVSLTGVRTKRELVNLALKELIRSRKKKNLFELAGKLELCEDFDHKALRDMRRDSD